MENFIVLPQHRASRFVQLTGFIFFGILFYFSWHFFKERMLAFDGAYSDFLLIMGGKPIAGASRYGDWIPLLLPWLALRLNFPLSAIVLLHSVSFILLHYLVFLFITLKLKNNGAGIAILLVSCLSYYHAFYNPMVELNESLIAGILLWALIHPELPLYTSKEKRNYTIGALLVILYMSFLHPLGIFIVAFVLGLEIIGAKRCRDTSLWMIAIIGIAWWILKHFLLAEPYDQMQIMPIKDLFSHASDWQTWPSTKFLRDFTRLHFRSLKWLGLICLLFSLRKGLLFFLFAFLSVVCYTFIVVANFQHGTSEIFYEDYYILYGFFIGLTLVYLFYKPGSKYLFLLLIIPILWTGLSRIYKAHNLYTDRLAYVERTVKQMHKLGKKKCLIDSRCYPYDYALTPWNFAFETLICSSLGGPDSSVSVFIKEPDVSRLCDSLQNRDNIFFGVHFLPVSFKPSKMPSAYFRLPSYGYEYLTHSQDDSSFHQEIYSSDNIKIIPLKDFIKLNVNDWGYTAIPIEVINTSGHIIPAIPRGKNPVLVSVKLTDSRGTTVLNETANCLESDVINEAGCGVTIPIFKEKGIYYAKIDLMTQGIRKWNVPSAPVKIMVE